MFYNIFQPTWLALGIPT